MFKSVTLYTNRLEQMEHFYTSTLQLPLAASEQHCFTVKIGSSSLTFKRSDSPASYHFAFNIPGNQIQPAKTWLSERVELNRENGKDEVYYKSFDAYAIYFEDPAGNVVELIGRKNRQFDGTFCTSSFLNISEMSVTTPFVSEVGRILQTAGLPSRNESVIDPNGLNFLGKVDCFVILVPPSRRWYFSTHVSVTCPLRIILRNGKTITIQENGKIDLCKL